MDTPCWMIHSNSPCCCSSMGLPLGDSSVTSTSGPSSPSLISIHNKFGFVLCACVCRNFAQFLHNTVSPKKRRNEKPKNQKNQKGADAKLRSLKNQWDNFNPIIFQIGKTFLQSERDFKNKCFCVFTALFY